LNSSASSSGRSTTPSALIPGETDVHIWSASLALPSSRLQCLKTILSSDEQERAGKFRFDQHRNRFIAARGLLRFMLSHYLQISPADVEFSYSSRGKPRLSSRYQDSGFQFNLAHSEDEALMAIGRVGELGVDIERIRPLKDMDHLVERFFSSRENELFQKLGAHEKPVAFFNLWTRKEALLKATGEGISHSLKLVEVSFLPDEPARILAIGGDRERGSRWTVKNVAVASGFIGAIALETKSVHISTVRALDHLGL
jgi:4'-phosphopantetheinyl transferase